MADITPTQVVVTRGKIRSIVLGVDTTIFGQLLYFDTSQGSWLLASAAMTVNESIVALMALEIALKDATIRAVEPNSIVDLGGASGLGQGQNYALSPTNPGGIAPYSDLAPTNYATSVGIARSSSELLFNVLNSRSTLP